MAISAALVKELREKTGVGMMDCKKALAETDGDFEAAVDWLRKKGLSKAAKKADRVAADGLVGIAVRGSAGAAVEINAETDFVARNETFQGFVREVADLALGAETIEALEAQTLASGATVKEGLTELIATIGENMTLRRFDAVKAEPGVVASYVHTATGEGLGRIGVLVALESEGDAGKLEELGRRIAMHVAAAAPLSLDVDQLDPAAVARERDILAEKARASGKPEQIIEKMVEGGLQKYYKESVLLKQVFVMDNETPIEKLVESAKSDVGAPVKLVGFVRMALGEGVEKKTEDFAAEVAAASGKA